MPGIASVRDRDAWATIQGFVYQAEITLDRWLSLKPGESLLLESGEDISLLARTLCEGGWTETVLREQVKHRSRAITLRSGSCVEFLVHAWQHCRAAGTTNVRCGYVTNSRAGKELDPGLALDRPGIEIWEGIRVGGPSASGMVDELEKLRTLVASAKKPSVLPEALWAAFESEWKAASQDELRAFICRVEWRIDLPSHAEMRRTLEGRLLREGRATTGNEASAQYERLLLRVISTLCKPGPKPLTIEDLDECLSARALDEATARQLALLREALSTLEERVATLEADSRRLEGAVRNLDDAVSALAKGQGIESAINYTVQQPILNPLGLAASLAWRRETVRTLSDLSKATPWVFVHGGVGTGKSQIVRLICEDQGGCRAWVRFGGQSREQASALLDSVVRYLLGANPGDRIEYTRLGHTLKKADLFILDDLPALSGDDPLTVRLTAFLSGCIQSGTRVMSTSNLAPPPKLRTLLGDKLLAAREMPPFTVEETKELFSVWGASEYFLKEKTLEFVHGITRGHPTLLCGLLRYLSDRKWRATTAVLGDLIGGSFAPDVTEQTQRLVRSTVENDQSRDLLYRLTLVLGTIQENQISAVASVVPPIERFGEHLSDLLGPWVRKETDGSYSLSPLVKKLGPQNLQAGTLRAAHSALGRLILRKRQVNQLEGMDAFLHFVGAEEFDSAGTVLVLALHSFSRLKVIENDCGFGMVWMDSPLPEQMNLMTKLYVRGSQVAFAEKLGKDATYALKDLDRLMELVEEKDAWMLIGPSLWAGPMRIRSNPVIANRYLRRALWAIDRAVLPDGKSFKQDKRVPVEFLLWVTGYRIGSPEELRDWISTFRALSPESRSRMLLWSDANECAMIVADSLLLAEHKKDVAKRDWPSVLAALKELEAAARELGAHVLAGCALRTQLMIHADYLKDFARAEDAFKQMLKGAPENPTVTFLAKESLGRQYTFAKRWERALPLLLEAIDVEVDGFATTRLSAIMWASCAASRDDQVAQAEELAKCAVSFARATAKVPTTELIKALGELAIEHWIRDRKAAAFDTLEEAVEKLLDSKSSGDGWKGLCVALANVVGRFGAVAHSGDEPRSTDGRVSIPGVERGQLTAIDYDLARFYKDSERILAFPLATIAGWVGNDVRAEYWVLRTLDTLGKHTSGATREIIGHVSLPYLIASGKFAESLAVSLNTATFIAAQSKLGINAGEAADVAIDPLQVLGSAPSEEWKRVDSFAATASVFPAMLRVCHIWTSDPEKGKAEASHLEAACRKAGSRPQSSSTWGEIADAVRQVFEGNATLRDLNQAGNTATQRGESALYVVFYLGSTVHKDALPEHVLKIHHAVLPSLFRTIKLHSPMWRKIVVPYFCDLWEQVFQRSRMRFTAPALVEKSLREAREKPIQQQVQEVLKTISFGLGVYPTGDTKAWLEGTK